MADSLKANSKLTVSPNNLPKLVIIWLLKFSKVAESITPHKINSLYPIAKGIDHTWRKNNAKAKFMHIA